MTEHSGIHDSAVRETALDPTTSFIVQAPAGSGKTELLMQRFLTLLATVEEPEDILAITFTRKAVGEMRTRIVEALESALHPPISDKAHEVRRHELARKVLERDRAQAWNILENPGRLKIQTIDSLCAALVRQMPLLSRLGRPPVVSEAPDELYREAARRTIAMVEDKKSRGTTLRRALSHFDNSVRTLEERLVTILEKRDQWLRHIGPDTAREGLREVLEDSLARMIATALEAARDAFPAHLREEVAAVARYAAANLRANGTESPVTALADVECPPGTNAGDLPCWRGIAELLLTKSNGWRKPGGINSANGFPAGKAASDEAVAMKRRVTDLLDRLSSDERCRAALAVVRSLPDPAYDEEEWEILHELLSLLPIADGHLKAVFAETGSVDFPAIAMAAIEALGPEESPTDLMLALDLKIQHILVDEYQDTSQRQRELLTALTRGWERGDGRSLFIVGDPMQSIYLFRDAEVSLFLDARQSGIGAIRFTPLTLTSNFRSEAAIVEWVNDTFNSAFPDDDDPFHGAMRYTPFAPVKPAIEGEGISVTTRLFAGRNDIREAEEIVNVVRSIDKSESIALLVRSRAHLREIVALFKREGIDFNSREIDPLILRPLTQDLLALLRALTHPCDRVAWLAVLRAPWCGLTLADLHALAGNDGERTIWSLVNDKERIAALSDTGRRILGRFRLAMEKALAVMGRVAPRRVLESLWIELGGPAAVDDDAVEDADLLFDLVDGVSSAGTIESPELLESRVARLYATEKEVGENPVNIMTIHKAKGLEFDHVILPGLGRRPRPSEKRLLLWLERGDDLLLAPLEKRGDKGGNAIYNYLRTIDTRKGWFETTRLFYVAATRAKRGLYLFGHTGETDADSNVVKVEPHSLLATMAHLLTPEKVREYRPQGSRPVSGDVAGESSVCLKRLSPAWIRPHPAETVGTVETPETASRAEEPRFDWANEGTRQLGTVLHRYFRRIVDEGLSRWDGKRVAAERARIGAMLLQSGLNRREVREQAERGIAILDRALRDRQGRWILADHGESTAELPVTGIVDGKLTRAVIDRCFVDNGVRWIIDYKFGSHAGGAVGHFLAEEKERYRPQMEAYAALVRAGGEERTIRRALYYPALSELVDIEDI